MANSIHQHNTIHYNIVEIKKNIFYQRPLGRLGRDPSQIIGTLFAIVELWCSGATIGYTGHGQWGPVDQRHVQSSGLNSLVKCKRWRSWIRGCKIRIRGRIVGLRSREEHWLEGDAWLQSCLRFLIWLPAHIFQGEFLWHVIHNVYMQKYCFNLKRMTLKY